MKKSIIRPSGNRTIILLVLLIIEMKLTAQTDSIANLPQFLFPDFTIGVIKLKTGEIVTASMNYNTLTEKMTFNDNGTLSDLNKPEVVDTILLQNKKFIFNVNAFYEVLVNEPVSLYIQHKSDLKSTGRQGAYGTTSQTVGPTSIPKLYGTKNTYDLKIPENYTVVPSPVYWVRINNVMHSFLTERQFLKIFTGKEEEIKIFIKQSELNIKKQDDLIKIVYYCNELIR
jgi:hypothetical protein